VLHRLYHLLRINNTQEKSLFALKKQAKGASDAYSSLLDQTPVTKGPSAATSAAAAAGAAAIQQQQASAEIARLRDEVAGLKSQLSDYEALMGDARKKKI